MRQAVMRVATALPDATLQVLEGQSHRAMDTSLAMFADAVSRFLGERAA